MYDEEIVREHVLNAAFVAHIFYVPIMRAFLKVGENRGIEIDFAITEVSQNVLTAYCLNLFSFSRQILTILTK